MIYATLILVGIATIINSLHIAYVARRWRRERRR